MYSKDVIDRLLSMEFKTTNIINKSRSKFHEETSSINLKTLVTLCIY